MKTNYLFYFCDGIGSVFDSQVLALLKAINEKNIFIKIYLFIGVRDKNQKKDLLARKLSQEIEIAFFKAYPNYQFFNFLIRKSIKTAILRQSINFNEIIFHTRGELIAWHLSKILESKYLNNIIPDVRGASVEEINEFYDSNQLMKSVKIVNYNKAVKNLIKFCKISVVSDSLKAYLTKKYNIESERIVITPSLAGSTFQFNSMQRARIRKELNLSKDDTLIVFSSGGTARWQNNDAFNVLAEKGIKVLNLSKVEIQHKNVINKFITYSEMPLYLNASDVAFIWRDKSIVNKVASPVKFSEYICCGLPVIANKSVEMINDYLSRYDCGLLIDSLEDIELSNLKKLNLMNREKISESGIINFGIETIVNKYFQTYSSIKCL